jgi:transcription-repair coupling factor (superfamily II helicase)
VDEEHRFGVRHKERLKQLRRMVDVMTLTATPIPRTLHMSLMGARDMSIIETPPKDRLPIHTEIVAFSEERIAEAILREVDRGGQVYFVRFGVGHGQMGERELEKVMLDFMEQKYDCLISTMIIESGLDIPTVNTLIVNRADRMGLAQLYQLRGRVGRSNQRAYAYLFIPSWKALRKPAARRLRAIEEFSDLGSGFHISMRDMEIRGAGNLLGAQQHGHITAIGFDMYCRLLDEAVRQIKGEEIAPGFEPEVQTSVSAYIPDEYIPDANLKMGFYQRMGDAKQSVELLAMEEELRDRFGPLPDATSALLDSIQVKLLARQLGIRMLTVGQEMVVRFLPERTLTREDVEGMVNASPLPLQFFLGEEARVEVDLEGNSPETRLSCAKNVLMSLL